MIRSKAGPGGIDHTFRRAPSHYAGRYGSRPAPSQNASVKPSSPYVRPTLPLASTRRAKTPGLIPRKGKLLFIETKADVPTLCRCLRLPAGKYSGGSEVDTEMTVLKLIRLCEDLMSIKRDLHHAAFTPSKEIQERCWQHIFILAIFEVAKESV